jgi:hypothetical protein
LGGQEEAAALGVSTAFSAVSQVCNLLALRSLNSHKNARRFADYKLAINRLSPLAYSL